MCINSVHTTLPPTKHICTCLNTGRGFALVASLARGPTKVDLADREVRIVHVVSCFVLGLLNQFHLRPGPRNESLSCSSLLQCVL